MHIISIIYRGVSVSHTVGRGFTPRPGHTNIKRYKLPPCLASCIRLGVLQCTMASYCLKTQVMCGTVFKGMLYKKSPANIFKMDGTNGLPAWHEMVRVGV